MTHRIFPIAATAALVALISGASAEPSDPAQAIAQKFYEASQPKIPPKPKVSVQAAPIAKPAIPAKPAQIVQSVQVVPPAVPGADYEREMLEQARAEQMERQRAYLERASAPPSSMADASEAGSENPPAPVAPLPAVAQGPSQQHEVAPAPDAEMIPPPAVPPKAIAAPAANDAPRAPPASPVQPEAAEIKGQRATVLVVLDDMGGAPGVRPDPILCFDQQCWISNGLEAPAKPMPRSMALTLKTTETPMGDSCSGKSACAFRNIPISSDAPVELVEVGESRGVGQGSYTITADTTCRKEGEELLCSNPLVTHEFRMWVVPESTAKAAGPSLLEGAIVDSLPDGDDVSDDGK